jgi:proline iminopeptidase
VTAGARERYAAFRRTLPRSPRLSRRTVRARGIDFAVFTTPPMPDALPLACVNGGMIYSHAILWPALAPLAAGRQLILYDLRGRGASGAAPGARQSRIEYDAGDLPAIREALGIARWDLLGHSWGGGIAMLGAARDVTCVRRLVLTDAVGVTSAWIAGLHEAALARLHGAHHARLSSLDPRLLVADDPNTHAEYSQAIYPAYFADREMAAAFEPPREKSRTGAAVAARLRRDGYDWRGDAARVAATTLIVHGAHDVLSPALAREAGQLIPRATVSIIDGAGHMPFWEQPAAYFALVTAFLDAPDRGA